MNANTSVVLGYSELIDSHRAGLQMERGFLTVFLGPAWEHMTLSLPPHWTSDQALLLYSVGPKIGDDGAARGRRVGGGNRERGRAFDKELGSPERPRKEGETRRDESPQTTTSIQARQRHLYVIRNALFSSTGL